MKVEKGRHPYPEDMRELTPHEVSTFLERESMSKLEEVDEKIYVRIRVKSPYSENPDEWVETEVEGTIEK